MLTNYLPSNRLFIHLFRSRFFYLFLFLLFISWRAGAQAYTLTDDDVEVVDGNIISCSYNFTNKEIIIPAFLDGQNVKGVDNGLTSSGVFMNKGLNAVTLPETITFIGSTSFAENNLTEIVLPENLELIGYGAFTGNLLVTLTITNNVNTIGELAFANNNLSDVTFASRSNWDIVYKGAFSGNENLSAIVLPTHQHVDFASYFKADGEEMLPGQDLSDFSQTVFANIPYVLTDSDVVVTGGIITSCNHDYKTKSLIIPSTLDGQTVKSIGSIGGIDGAFKGMFSQKGLRYVELPETLEGIGRNAFMGNAISFIELPNSVNVIQYSAFAYNSLEHVDLPESLKIISAYSFRANSIKKVNLPKSVELIESMAFFNNQIENLFIPSSIKTIQEDAFLNNYINNVTFESNSNLRLIEGDAFAGNAGLIEIELPTHQEEDFTAYFDSNLQSYQPGDIINNFSLVYKTKITHTLTDSDVVIIDGIIISCSYDLNNTSIVIPQILDDQTVIGIAGDSYTGVFQGNGLVSVELPGTIKSIGGRAFYGNELSNINLPQGLETVGKSAFSDNQLVKVTIPSSVESIEEKAFYNNDLESVSFQADSYIQTIGKDAFYNNAHIGTVTLPTNARVGFVEYVDGLGRLFLPGDNIKLEYATYARVPYTLTDDDVVVTDGVISSSSYDFESKHIIIPNELDGQILTGIYSGNSSGLFRNKGIISIELPPNLTYIGPYSFRDNEISRIEIPESIITIDVGAFYKNPMYHVLFGEETNLLRIGSSAFTHEISNFYVNFSLPKNRNENFLGYSDSQGTRINQDEEVDYKNYEIYARVAYQLTDEDVEVKDHTIVSCSYNTDFKVVIIPDVLDDQEIYGIGNKVFYDLGMDSVRLPSSLKAIGDWAFRRNFLENIEFPTDLEKIGYWAFESNNLKEIDLPSKLLTIEGEAFIRNKLKRVDMGCLGYVGASAFSANAELKEIKFPANSNVDFLGYRDSDLNRYLPGDSFSNFSKYYYARIPYTLTDDDVEVVGDTIVSADIELRHKVIIIPDVLDDQTVRAIANDDNQKIFRNLGIDSVKLPSTLKSIGRSAFKSNHISKISFPEGLTTIHSDAFEGNLFKEIILPRSIEYLGYGLFDVNPLIKAEFEENSNLLYMEAGALNSNGSMKSVKLPDHADGGFVEYRDSQYAKYAARDSLYTGSRIVARIAYTLNDDDVLVENDTLKECRFDSKYNVIVIPDSLDGQSIKAIAGNDNLDNNPNFVRQELDSIKLPSNLVYIGKWAFYGNQLNSVELPESLVVIEEEAFKFNNMYKLHIPSGVKKIGESAFQSSLLKLVHFEQNSDILSIGLNAFFSGSLDGFELPTSSYSNFITFLDDRGIQYSEGDFYTSYRPLSVQMPYVLKDEDVEVYEGRIISCSYSFDSKYIIIPDTLDNQYVEGIIGANDRHSEAPFKGKRLDSLSLPSGLNFLGSYAFFSSNLKFLDLPDSLEIIEEGAFSNNEIASIVIPKKIKKIGEAAFEDNNLFHVSFEQDSNIEQIGEGAFINNPNLVHYTLPRSSNPEFVRYVDNFGDSYNPGDEVTHLSREVEIRLKRYPLIIEIEGQGQITPTPGWHQFYKGQFVEFDAMPSSGWAFEKWMINDIEYFTSNLEIQIKEDTTKAVALFKRVLVVEDQLEKNHKIFQVHPIPAKDQLNISVFENSGAYTILLFSLEGQLIRAFEGEIMDSVSFDIKSLRRGVYLLKIIDENGGSSIKRVVKG